MALPKITAPTFTVELPFTNKEIKYRPFTVDEQKHMLIAAQGGDTKDILLNMVNLVDACTFGKHDFINKSIAQFEKVFLAIRSKSVGEIIEINYRCTNDVTEDGATKKCNHRNRVDVDFMKQTTFNETPESLIHIVNDIKIKLSETTMNDVINGYDMGSVEILKEKIEYVSDGDEIITEFEIDELKEFISSIPVTAGAKIVEYFNNQSVAHLHVPTRCKKCGCQSSIDIKGAVHFFV